MNNMQYATRNTEIIKDLPLISIIVPVYKVEEYLGNCIDAILNQTYRNFELILVNDGSPDRCGQICDEYAQRDNRIVVIHKENGGVSTARNVGIDTAKGDYIAFIDPDDWVEKTLLETYVDNIEEDSLIVINVIKEYLCGEINNNLLKLQGDRKFDFIKDVELMIKEKPCKELMMEEAPWYLSLSFPFNKLYSAKIIKENNIRFEEGLTFAEDDRFNAEYYGYVKVIKFVDQSLYHYIERKGSAVMTNRNIGNLIERLRTNVMFYTMIKNTCRYTDYIDNYFRIKTSDFFYKDIMYKIHKTKQYSYIWDISKFSDKEWYFLQVDTIPRKIDYWLLRNRMPRLFYLFRLLRVKISK